MTCGGCGAGKPDFTRVIDRSSNQAVPSFTSPVSRSKCTLRASSGASTTVSKAFQSVVPVTETAVSPRSHLLSAVIHSHSTEAPVVSSFSHLIQPVTRYFPG